MSVPPVYRATVFACYFLSVQILLGHNDIFLISWIKIRICIKHPQENPKGLFTREAARSGSGNYTFMCFMGLAEN